MLITFSGLDGAGKSTLISRLNEIMEGEGHRVCVRTMYFHLSLYAQIRHLRNRLFFWRDFSSNGKPSTYNLIPNLEKPDVSDKSKLSERVVYGIFRSRFVRRLSLFGDLIIFSFYLMWKEVIRGEVLLVDRYFYDSLADVISQKKGGWRFVRFFLKLCPTPHLPVFVDVPPEVAYARKREYPLDYMKWRREIYQRIFKHLENPLVLDNQDLEHATKQLEGESVRRGA